MKMKFAPCFNVLCTCNVAQEVDMFAKDYVMVPISNASADGRWKGNHWSLVIICHLPVLHEALQGLEVLQEGKISDPALASGDVERIAALKERAVTAVAAAAAAVVADGASSSGTVGGGLRPTPVILHLDSCPGGHVFSTFHYGIT
jgi:Ulp1 family protease